MSNLYRRVRHRVSMLTNIHRPDRRPNAFIFSTPRSGSTLLMEMILTQQRFKSVNEPFNLRNWVIREYLATQGIQTWHDLYDITRWDVIKSYVSRTCSGSLHISNPIFYKNYYRLITSRLVLKILHAAEDRIQELATACNGCVILLIRHPLPVSMSRRVLPRLQAFLQTDYRRHFSARELRAADSIAAHGDKLEKAVLDWCLQNALPLRMAQEDWIIITYEQLVLDPASVVDRLVERLALRHPERMLSRISVPSTSTNQSDNQTRRVLSNSNGDDARRWLVDKWHTKLQQADESRLMAIVEEFGIDTYTAGSTLPKGQYWLSPRKISTARVPAML